MDFWKNHNIQNNLWEISEYLVGIIHRVWQNILLKKKREIQYFQNTFRDKHV